MQIIDSIHGKIDTFDDKITVKGGSMWKRIVRQWEELREDRLDPRQLMKRCIGNGKDTRFWKDRWAGDKPLGQLFPRAFNFDPIKNASVHDRITNGGLSRFRSDFIREGRAKEEFNEVLSIISAVTLKDKKDTWSCPGGPKKVFTVAWLRHKIGEKNQSKTAKNRWSKWIPKKINILIWRTCRDRLAVKNNLAKIQAIAINTICDVCKADSETVIHAFFDCTIAKENWARIVSWWGLKAKNF